MDKGEPFDCATTVLKQDKSRARLFSEKTTTGGSTAACWSAKLCLCRTSKSTMMMATPSRLMKVGLEALDNTALTLNVPARSGDPGEGHGSGF